MHHWSRSCGVVASPTQEENASVLSSELGGSKVSSNFVLFLILVSQNSEKPKQEFFIFNDVTLLPLEQHLFFSGIGIKTKTKGVSIKAESSQ